MRRRRPDGERGAVLVEFAMASLMLVTLLAGAYDFGMGWRAGLAANEGVRAGARVGSGQGERVTADYSLLSSMRSALQSSGLLGRVERVVIFQSTTANGQVPSACVNGSSGTAKCNVLTGAQLRDLASSSDGALSETGCIVSSTVKRWCPTTRDAVQLSADYLGVWVRVRHEYMFPLLGDDITIDRTAVMRLEPEETNP